jgi:hypothetical protein
MDIYLLKENILVFFSRLSIYYFIEYRSTLICNETVDKQI